MNKFKTIRNLLLGISLLGVVTSCKKYNDNLFIPDNVAHFLNDTAAVLYIPNTTTDITYNIPVGVTRNSLQSRVLKFNVTSPTGAVAGTNYTVLTNSVTLAPNSVIDTFKIKCFFTAGRIDTLNISYANGSAVPASPYNDTFKLVVYPICPVVFNNLLGSYTNCSDSSSVGQNLGYTTTVTNTQAPGATAGTILVSNFAGSTQASPIRVQLNWSNNTNLIARLFNNQPIIIGGTSYALTTTGVPDGSFDMCNQTFTVYYNLRTVTPPTVTVGPFKTVLKR